MESGHEDIVVLLKATVDILMKENCVLQVMLDHRTWTCIVDVQDGEIICSPRGIRIGWRKLIMLLRTACDL